MGAGIPGPEICSQEGAFTVLEIANRRQTTMLTLFESGEVREQIKNSSLLKTEAEVGQMVRDRLFLWNSTMISRGPQRCNQDLKKVHAFLFGQNREVRAKSPSGVPSTPLFCKRSRKKYRG